MAKIRTFSADEELIEERRTQIAQAALQIFTKTGIRKTGVREIAATCSMTLGNLYHYIGKKEDIIWLAFNYVISQKYRLSREVADECDRLDALNALKYAIDRNIRHQDATRSYTIFIFRELGSMIPSVRLALLEQAAQGVDFFAAILKRGRREGLFAVDDPDLVAETILTVAEMWALKHFQYKKKYTLDDYIKFNTQMILKQVTASS